MTANKSKSRKISEELVLLKKAFMLHQEGKFKEAESSYIQVLKIEPNQFEALQLLGTLFGQMGKYNESIEILSKFIKIYPNHASSHNNYGMALQKINCLDKAVFHFEKAIFLNQNLAEAYNNLGNVLQEMERFEESIENCNRAISIKSNFPEAYNNLGNAFFKMNQFQDALSSYKKAISFNSYFAEAFNNLGNCLREMLFFKEALFSYDQALQINPNYPEAYFNKGETLRKQNLFKEALDCFNSAINSNPTFAEAFNSKGLALFALRNFDLAQENYNKAILIKPNYAEPYNNLGIVLQELGNLIEATAHYEKAIFIKSEFAEAHLNLAMCRLLKKDFKNGWFGYEWRRQVVKDLHDKYLERPNWNGVDSIENKTILLYAEQGIGDTIQFCRYIKLVSKLGARIILEVQEPLVDLLIQVEGVSQIVTQGNNLPEADYQCSLMSLPLAFNTTQKNIPSSTPYLNSDKNKVDKWKNYLGRKTKPRIGLVWSSASSFVNDSKRSLTLSELLSALPKDRFEYICLQKEIQLVDQEVLLRNPQIRFFGSKLENFTDTAALIDCVDLVVSTCTSVPHLSGALGKETWLLIPYMPDWRWQLSENKTLWYPSFTLYRQSIVDKWDEVLLNLYKDLEIWLQKYDYL